MRRASPEMPPPTIAMLRVWEFVSPFGDRDSIGVGVLGLSCNCFGFRLIAVAQRSS